MKQCLYPQSWVEIGKLIDKFVLKLRDLIEYRYRSSELLSGLYNIYNSILAERLLSVVER